MAKARNGTKRRAGGLARPGPRRPVVPVVPIRPPRPTPPRPVPVVPVEPPKDVVPVVPVEPPKEIVPVVPVDPPKEPAPLAPVPPLQVSTIVSVVGPPVYDGIEPRRAYAERVLARTLELGRHISSAFYAFGLHLKELSRYENVRALGYATFHELLEGRRVTARMMAHRLTSIVDALDQPDAEKFGVDKSYALIRYAAVAKPGVDAMTLVRSDPVVFVHGRTTRLSEATAQDLLAAVREHTRVILPDAYRKRVHSASRGISQRLERIEIHSARVRSIQRGQRMVVRIEVDGEEAAQFLQFLRRK